MGFVFQRPQHLMTRLASGARIFFFEEPVPGHGATWLEVTEPLPNLFVCRPIRRSPKRLRRYAASRFAKNLLELLITERQIERPVAWFYTPMALPLLQSLDAAAVVYDCMDELSAFHNAPPELLERERALLRIRGRVFTGGPSLFRAKQALHGQRSLLCQQRRAGAFRKGQGFRAPTMSSNETLRIHASASSA
jgi:hypothetical protein